MNMLWANPRWSWEIEFLANVATIAALGLSAGYVAHCVWHRNTAGRRDRLVWGLLGFFNAIFALFTYSALVILGLLPEYDWLRWTVRIFGIAAGVTLAVAVKTADPLVYLEDLRLLNQRILTKRATIAALEAKVQAKDHEIALIKLENKVYHEKFGPLP